MKKSDLCPCCSSKNYGDCCNLFLGSSTSAPTAEQLMRSRYTAFVLEKALYLVETHHPQSRQQDELKALKNRRERKPTAGAKSSLSPILNILARQGDCTSVHVLTKKRVNGFMSMVISCPMLKTLLIFSP